MSRPSFDVLHERWIPVRRLDGSSDELGILACLEHAHALREIRDPSPIVEFGLYRLLVAFVLDALVLAGRRPEDSYDLRDLIGDGRFDMALFSGYVLTCGNAFDLFDPERPFLQRSEVGGELKSVFDFYPVFPTGNNSTLFAHQTTEAQVEKPSGVARLLTTVAPFNVKVKTGQPRTIVGDPPIYALPTGNTLLETLVYNLPLPDARFTLHRERAQGPAWRTIPSEDQSGTTPAQSFTWPSRFVKIAPPDAEGNVTTVSSDRGLRALRGWKDPACAVLQDGEGKVRHLRIEEARPLWLDAGPLSFLSAGSVRRWGKEWAASRPQVVTNVLDTWPERDLHIQFFGLRTDQAKVLEWSRTRWSIPASLGESTRLGGLVQRELERSEKAAWLLRTAIRTLYPRAGAGAKNPLGAIVNRCGRAFWLRLETEFVPLMESFAALDADAPDDPDLVTATAQGWRSAIGILAREQFELVAKDMDSDSDALKRAVDARAWLHVNLRKVLS